MNSHKEIGMTSTDRRRLKMSSFIVDAEGMFHDLAKGAFDAITIRDPNQPSKINSELFNQPLEALSQGIKEHLTEKMPGFSQYWEPLEGWERDWP